MKPDYYIKGTQGLQRDIVYHWNSDVFVLLYK